MYGSVLSDCRTMDKEDINKPASELYLASRQQVNQHDFAIGLRLIWLNNSQAFMFGIYAGTTVFQASTPFFLASEHNLTLLIPIIGLLISLFTLSDIITSLVQMGKLYRGYKNRTEEQHSFPLAYTGFTNRLLQRLSPVLSCLLFIIVWLYLINYDHHLI